MTPQKVIVRVTILALLIMLASAISKGVLFHSVLAPDETGRQPIEKTSADKAVSGSPESRREEDNHAQ